MSDARAAIEEAREAGRYQDPAGRWIVRPYRPGDEERILALFRCVFGVDRSLEQWRWRFRDNPAGLTIRLAETPSGELVGQYAGLPVRMAWGDRTLVFTQIIDVMVDPRLRQGLKRAGLFAALANRFIADYGGPDRISGGFGFPTPEALRIGRRVAGYIPLHPVVSLIRPVGRHGGDRRSRLAGLFRVEATDRFDGEIDRLWERVRPELPVAGVRDACYLNWRYADCPDVGYQMLVARHRLGGAPAGAAILRLGVRGEPIGALVDWLVPRRATSAALALVGRCEALAKDAGMERLAAWFPPYSWPYRWLLESGFRQERTIYQFVALPTSPVVSLDWARDRWYYAMGDSDIY
jgi:hypothetical protein